MDTVHHCLFNVQLCKNCDNYFDINRFDRTFLTNKKAVTEIVKKKLLFPKAMTVHLPKI